MPDTKHEFLSEEEHIARAMLLGMRYHGGNGEPFYYALDAGGNVDTMSMVDANTLEPLRQVSNPLDDLFYVSDDRAFAASKAAIHEVLVERARQQWGVFK